MSHLLSVLHEMRGRLGMYLGTTSLTKLAGFLRGYEHALAQHGESDSLLADFRDWIHERFHSAKRSWEDTILLQSTDEVHAVECFWNLLDLFLEQRRVPWTAGPSAAGSNGTQDSGLPGQVR